MFKKLSTFLLLGTTLLLTACSDNGPVKSNLSQEDARTEVEAYYKKIDPQTAELKKVMTNVPLSDADELPNIETAYPYTVKGDGQVDVEIFVSSEKAGTGKDGIINELAEQFNKQKQTIGNETISVSVRSIPSGTAMDYISSKKHTPDGYTPSNMQWAYMLNSKGVSTQIVTERLFGNTSGLLMKESVYDDIKSKYGDVTVETVAQAVKEGKLLGYTNPYSSSTGLSFLSELLYSFDPNNPISDDARAKFKEFQANIETTFLTTSQLREAAKSGTADILSISYNTYINTPEFSGYKYIPFGVRQDSPLLSTTNDTKKNEVLTKFSNYLKEEQSQRKASSYGFNQLDEYTFTDKTTDGGLLTSMQGLWKRNKNAKPIVGVFVTDVSGSMSGDPINNLRRSLLNSLQYINEENRIGLVSYDSKVTINVPIAAMDAQQKGYFTNAINELEPGDSTATYNGTLVAIKMILDDMKANPGSRPIIFVLSDGEQNDGYSFDRLAPIVKSLGITIHTIGYNANIDELKKLAQINESVSIDADSEDVTYKIKELFNAEF